MLLYAIFLSVVLIIHTDLTEPRIIGGYNADITEYPSMISIRFNRSHWCGGSIYKSNIVISAAHCFRISKNISDFTISAGSTFLSEAQYNTKVKKIIVHESFDLPLLHNNDIALLILETPLFFNSRVMPIRLLKRRVPSGYPVTVIGWGLTEERGTHSDHLQQVEVELVSNDQCQEKYPNDVITKNMLCAGYISGGKDACQEDSGGPMIFNRELIGIVSFGHGCARYGIPGVYASIPDLYDWIIENVKSNVAL